MEKMHQQISEGLKIDIESESEPEQESEDETDDESEEEEWTIINSIHTALTIE